MSPITPAAFPTVRSVVKVRDSEPEELASGTEFVALVDEENAELAQFSGIVEPAVHALCADLVQSNACSLAFADSETEVSVRLDPGAAAQALPRHAIAQAASRRERNRDEVCFNIRHEDIWTPED